jgi:hypothetical protein
MSSSTSKVRKRSFNKNGETIKFQPKNRKTKKNDPGYEIKDYQMILVTK